MVHRTLSPKRFQHTMHVKKLAVRMAQHYGVDTEKAALAAVLHDSAKELPRTELLQIMQDNAIIKKGTQNRPEPVWHGICAAILAKTQWNVQDEEILSAIACHTTGQEIHGRLVKKRKKFTDFLQVFRRRGKNLLCIHFQLLLKSTNKKASHGTNKPSVRSSPMLYPRRSFHKTCQDYQVSI